MIMAESFHQAEPVASIAGTRVIANGNERMMPTNSCPKTKQFDKEQTNAALGSNRMKRKSVMSPNFKKKKMKKCTGQEKLVLLYTPQRTSIPRHPNPFVSQKTLSTMNNGSENGNLGSCNGLIISSLPRRSTG